MFATNRNITDDTREPWHLKAFNHLLEKHGVRLNPEQKKQIDDIDNFTTRLDPSALERLDVLCLFETALKLNKENRFVNEDGNLDIVDLFYASTLVGLKINRDTLYMPLNNIAPKSHRYFGNIKKLYSLERALIERLEWRFHPETEITTENYAHVLSCLDQEALAEFSAELLLLSLSKAGDFSPVQKMVSRLNAELGERITNLMNELQYLPLVYCYLESRLFQARFKSAIFNFLQGKKSAWLSDDLLWFMQKSIQHYFENLKRAISNVEFADLAYYFDQDTIKKIKIKNFTSRLEKIRYALRMDNPNIQNIFNLLFEQLKSETLNPAWFSSTLSALKILKKSGMLSENIFILAFGVFSETQPILNAYVAIHREGWLALTNDITMLKDRVNKLVLTDHDAPDLTNKIRDELIAYFNKNNPTLRQLKQLCNTATSREGMQLATSLTTTFILKKMEATESKLKIDPNVLKARHDAMRHYLNAHPEKQMSLAYTANLLSVIPFELTESFYLNLLSKPAQMQFKVKLAICLPEEKEKYPFEATSTHDLLLFIYDKINKNAAVLQELNEYFQSQSPAANFYKLSRTKLTEKLVEQAITQFNTTNGQPNATASQPLTHSPSIRLFSPAKNEAKQMNPCQCVCPLL